MIMPILLAGQQTFTICAGESVYLEAIQTFPTPAQPPAGPDGGIPATPCTPQLTDISVDADIFAQVDLRGITITPTTSGIYTVTSNGVCGGPGAGNTGTETISYEVIVETCTPTTAATFTICAGESVYLEAIQTFPTPAQPPAGPDGGIPATPCTPQLTDISVDADIFAQVDLRGITITPTTSGIYTVTSNGVCGGPGAGNTGTETISYEVIVETCTPTTAATFTICAGESVYLEAIQTFPTPAQPPAGPDGGIPATPCTPQLTDISVDADVFSQVDLRGITITPTMSGIYTVTSNGVCGGPGAGNTGTETISYEVIVETCGTTASSNDVFLNFPWLVSLINPATCFSSSVRVYQSGDIQFVAIVDELGAEQLYFQDGTFYCQSSANYNCVALYGLQDVAGSWTCGMESRLPDCNTTGGTFFFEDCNGTLFFFLQLDDGRIVDPYFDGINFSPQEGQRVFIDFVEADFPTPCPNASAAITITCILPEVLAEPDFSIDEEVFVSDVFFDYPWLNELLDPTFCSEETVSVYEQGVYKFLLVTNNAGEERLYFEDGTFYCQNAPNYNCVVAYGFGDPIDFWTCNSLLPEPTIPVDARLTGSTSTQKAFPNPTTGQLTLFLDKQEEMQQINVIDIQGRILQNFRIDGAHNRTSLELNLTNYPAGVYYIQRQSGAILTMEKVIKQ